MGVWGPLAGQWGERKVFVLSGRPPVFRRCFVVFFLFVCGGLLGVNVVFEFHSPPLETFIRLFPSAFVEEHSLVGVWFDSYLLAGFSSREF